VSSSRRSRRPTYLCKPRATSIGSSGSRCGVGHTQLDEAGPADAMASEISSRKRTPTVGLAGNKASATDPTCANGRRRMASTDATNKSESAWIGQRSSSVRRLESSGRDSGGTIGPLRGVLNDLVGGIVLGSAIMCLLFLMDFCNIINLSSARAIRKASTDAFNAPEIIRSLNEDGSGNGRRYLSSHDWYAIQKELRDSKYIIGEEQKVLEAREAKARNIKSEISRFKPTYDRLLVDAGLDVFCPTCEWGMGMNCQARVNYLLEKYSDSAKTIEVINKLVEEGKVKNGRCLKS